MADPYPLIAFWDDAPPALAEIARALRASAAIFELSTVGDANAVSGLAIALPGGASLFFETRGARTVRFALSGPDSLQVFGAAEAAATSAILLGVMQALVEAAGAAAAWCGRVRDDQLGDHAARFEAAMTTRRRGAALPLPLLEPVIWRVAWPAASPVDLPCTMRRGEVCMAGDPMTTPFG